jgi:predicted phage tail protein
VDGTDTLLNIEELVFSDSVAPLAPTAVTAVAGSRVARINFGLPLSVVESFEVRVVDASGAQDGALRTIADPEATTFLVTGLTNGQTYRFQVRAVNAFGTGPFSALSNAVTPRSTVPAAPALPTATAGDRQAAVSWTAPDNGGEPITSYDVRVSNLAGAQVGVLRQTTQTSLTVTGLTNGTQYSFAVRANNSVGAGAFSDESVLVTPRPAPAPPGNPTPPGNPGGPGPGNGGGGGNSGPGNANLAATTVSSSSVTLTLTPPATDGGSPVLRFAVQVLDSAGRQVGALRTAPASARSIVVTGLTNGLVYSFRVRAENAIGAGAWSAPVTAKPVGPPPVAPALIDLAPRATSVKIRWKAPTNDGGAAITHYRIKVMTATGSRVGSIRIVSGSAHKVAIRGLASGTKYKFKVQAENSLGKGAFGPSKAVRTR